MKKKKRKGRCHDRRRSKEANAITTLKMLVNVPEFTGKDLSEFAESFRRFLWMTGHTHASWRVKCDLLLQCCKTTYLKKQVKQIVHMSATFADVLVALERQLPSYETVLSVWTEIQRLAMLPKNPKAARISELLAHLDNWVARLTPGSTSCFSGWWPRSHETFGMSVGPRRGARQEPSSTRTWLYFYWSSRWRRRVTSISTPAVPEETILGTMAVGIKDLDLDKGLPLRMLAT